MIMEVMICNSAPTSIQLENILEQGLADELIALVDERGKKTNYNGNPDTLELRLGGGTVGFLGAGVADSREMQCLTQLQQLTTALLPYIQDAFKNTALETITGHRGFWLMRYGPGGEFTEHVDWSLDEEDDNSTPAVATLCVYLNEDYTGGQKFLAGQPIDCPALGGEVHDGWTYHRVEPVEEGNRYIVCVHFLGTLKS